MTKQLKQQNSVGIKIANFDFPSLSKKEITFYNSYLVDKKLKDFNTKDDLLLMNSLIIRWANYIGISSPESHELNTLSNFIKENFSSFNAFDIQECISLLVTDKLNTDAQPYGKLSPIYVSKVLKAYQFYRNEIVFKVRKKIEEQKQLEAPKPSKEERLKNFKILLEQAKETILKKEPFMDFGELIYNFIKKNKLIFMPDLKDEAMKYGNEMFLKKAQGNSIKAVIRGSIITHLKKEELVKQFAREYVTVHWLNTTDIKEVVSKLTFEMID